MAEIISVIPDQRPGGSGPASDAVSGSPSTSASAPALAASVPVSQPAGSSSPLPLPRVTIRFCTQCKWMLRAAYFAQELLSTFSTSLGEVALQPTTGGIFVVEIYHADLGAEVAGARDTTPTTTGPGPSPTTQHRVLWDRKVDGGFPETKELKRRVRDVIEPGRNLGHVDRDYPRNPQAEKDDSRGEPTASPRKDAMPEIKQQQAQPPGPRWPQLHGSRSSQPPAQEGQIIPDPHAEAPADTSSQTGPQSRTPKDLGPYPRQRTTHTGDPVYDPRMPGGGVMPVVPPVAPSSRSEIQGYSSETRSQPEMTRTECEDCQ
ncbi:putative selenoprotein W-like protein [Rosellinia necatrix]|uniref:Putative selenoprotein W-like protein n=1 Tax=Rosellinia necatrix TaxID=77044 RepID=A0A1W2TRJ9_ROSNE|nr:putative selenoprotein W-like protein [Rosellinia necatrix]